MLKALAALTIALVPIASPALAQDIDPSALYSGQDIGRFMMGWQNIMIAGGLGYVNREVTIPQATSVAQSFCRMYANGATSQDIANRIIETHRDHPVASAIMLDNAIAVAAQHYYCPNAKHLAGLD